MLACVGGACRARGPDLWRAYVKNWSVEWEQLVTGPNDTLVAIIRADIPTPESISIGQHLRPRPPGEPAWTLHRQSWYLRSGGREASWRRRGERVQEYHCCVRARLLPCRSGGRQTLLTAPERTSHPFRIEGLSMLTAAVPGQRWPCPGMSRDNGRPRGDSPYRSPSSFAVFDSGARTLLVAVQSDTVGTPLLSASPSRARMTAC